MIEKVSRRDLFTVGAGGSVELPDLGVDQGGLAGDGFQHGIGAESVKVGAGVGEGETLGDGAEGDGWVQGESVCGGYMLVFG